MSKILIIEDDKQLATTTASVLKRSQHDVEMSHDGADASVRLAGYVYDLVVLDWEIPFVSGVELCKTFRQKGLQTPILMLTGKSHISEKTVGFEVGADDYLTKPFDIQELKLRVDALLRRPSAVRSHTVKAGPIELNVEERWVKCNDKDVKLSPKEFGLLEYLMRHENQVFNAHQLLKAVWTAEQDAGPETIKTHIKNLRAKLSDGSERSVITTVFGSGYKFTSQPDAD